MDQVIKLLITVCRDYPLRSEVIGQWAKISGPVKVSSPTERKDAVNGHVWKQWRADAIFGLTVEQCPMMYWSLHNKCWEILCYTSDQGHYKFQIGNPLHHVQTLYEI